MYKRECVQNTLGEVISDEKSDFWGAYMRESERFLVIDQMIAEKEVVTLTEFQNVLQVSPVTVKRDLRKMREVTDTPIVYSKGRGGYVYDVSRMKFAQQTAKPRFSVKRLGFSEDELHALVGSMCAYKRLAQDPESAVNDRFSILLARMRTLFGFTDERENELLSRIKIFEPTVPTKPTSFFPVICSALCEHRRLQTAYEPVAGECEILEVSPLRLVCKEGLWYLDVYSYLDREYRTLALSGLTQAEVLPTEGIVIPSEELALKLDQLHTKPVTSEKQKAELLFDEVSTPVATLEVWHRKQKASVSNKRLTLTVPYGDDDEIVNRILKWGVHVEVKAPEELRRKICTTLEQILSLYR